MNTHAPSLTSLIGSRICHDLISPIGAITNGLELLELAGAASSPELALIGDSIENAGARIRFFRIAYGIAGQDAMVQTDIAQILADYCKGSRVKINWQISGDVPRAHVRLAFLAIQCLETALAFGGDIRVTANGDVWVISGQAPRLLVDDELWSDLTRSDPKQEITPALVQFALLPVSAAEAGRSVRVETRPTQVTLTF